MAKAIGRAGPQGPLQAGPGADGGGQNARAALLMTLGMAGFAFEDTLLKLLSRAMPTGQVLMIVGLAGMVVFGSWVALRGGGLRPRDLLHRGVLARNLCEAICAICFVTALATGDLSIASAILQALPLLMTLGAALFLSEPVGWRRWLSILAGFAGVLLIVRPGTDAYQPASLLALIAVLALAARDLITRRLPPGIGSGMLTASAFGAMAFAGAVLALLGGQRMMMPDARQAAMLLACVGFGLGGYLAMVIATRIGEIGAIAPFRYSRLIFAILLAMAVFGERPDGWTLAGAGIIAAAGGYAMWREARLRGRPRTASPGGPIPPG
ncbi:DMT family transporter [Paracoccus spongiarum]|uniref:DMT family transporter n=1 Tax=Paracoccus spongiarum TaxID=3064387 RepID=A0ABT9JFZ6_9RHOB|nr:DMT family transporter [Paracoccus sp. 2205BS29-5]MDP5308012.1 DMT family transporter [Paracoccus sp. 2205BS29-5]